MDSNGDNEKTNFQKAYDLQDEMFAELRRLEVEKRNSIINKVYYVSLISGQEFVGMVKMLIDGALVLEHPCEVVYHSFEDDDDSMVSLLELAFPFTSNRLQSFSFHNIIGQGPATAETTKSYMKIYEAEVKKAKDISSSATSLDSNGVSNTGLRGLSHFV